MWTRSCKVNLRKTNRGFSIENDQEVLVNSILKVPIGGVKGRIDQIRRNNIINLTKNPFEYISENYI